MINSYICIGSLDTLIIFIYNYCDKIKTFSYFKSLPIQLISQLYTKKHLYSVLFQILKYSIFKEYNCVQAQN